MPKKFLRKKLVNTPMLCRTSATANSLDPDLEMFSGDRNSPTEPEQITTNQLDNATNKTTGLMSQKMSPTTSNYQSTEITAPSHTNTGLELWTTDRFNNSLNEANQALRYRAINAKKYILKFTNWETDFEGLPEAKNITGMRKPHLLKKYVGREAKKYIKGSLTSNTVEEYGATRNYHKRYRMETAPSRQFKKKSND